MAHTKTVFGNRVIVSPLSPIALNRNHIIQSSQSRLDFICSSSFRPSPRYNRITNIPPLLSQTRSNRIPPRGGIHQSFGSYIPPIIPTAKTPYIPPSINLPTTNNVVRIRPQPNNRLRPLRRVLYLRIHIPRLPFAWMAFGVGEYSCGSRRVARGS